MTLDRPVDMHEFWLFGYGSLIWKPPPHFDRRVPGFIRGYVRRFWQASEDHRGTPANPGRVVTLIQREFWDTLDDEQRATEGDKVWGVAYRIIPDKVKEVQEYLDIREINGYSIQYTPFHPADTSMADIYCLVYIGMPDNPQFLGPLKPADVAQKINESIGPSGRNPLEALSAESHDEHISDLAIRVRAMDPSGVPQERMLPSQPSRQLAGSEKREEVEKVLPGHP